MSILELKKHLKSRIDAINDDDFLIELNLVLVDKYNRIDDYNLDLEKSELDIKLENVYLHSQVLEKVAQWKKR